MKIMIFILLGLCYSAPFFVLPVKHMITAELFSLCNVLLLYVCIFIKTIITLFIITVTLYFCCLCYFFVSVWLPLLSLSPSPARSPIPGPWCCVDFSSGPSVCCQHLSKMLQLLCFFLLIGSFSLTLCIPGGSGSVFLIL